MRHIDVLFALTVNSTHPPNTCAALALAGFVGLAPNIYHPSPDDTPSNNAAYSKFIANHTELDILDDIQAGASYLRAQTFIRRAGWELWAFASADDWQCFTARSREINALVTFHPGVMKADEIKRLNVPVQIHHGTTDESVAVTESLKLEKMLRAQGTPVVVFLYEGANHGFPGIYTPVLQT